MPDFLVNPPTAAPRGAAASLWPPTVAVTPDGLGGRGNQQEAAMAMLTGRAAAAIAEALHTAEVPALRARLSRGGAPTATDYGGSPTVVETELARRRGPGEVGVTSGAAIVYLPASLLEAYPDIVVDLHGVPDRSDQLGWRGPPTLRLGPPAGLDQDPETRRP